MRSSHDRLSPGDLVEVKTPDEILRTLDGDGTVGRLPFMPEMAEFCGERFTVSRRVFKTCVSGATSTMVGFATDDVVLLEGLRCSGAAHDGCAKACTILWREAWLERVDHSGRRTRPERRGRQRLLAHLKTSSKPGVYFCQASQLLSACRPLSHRERLLTCVRDVRARNCSAFEMARLIAIWLIWRIRRAALGEYGRGTRRATPVERLDLQPGESVQVKAMADIRDTLNERAANRGLRFFPDMRRLCGRRSRVRSRLDRIIVDGTGEMRKLGDTVYLEGSMCDCTRVAFGGCPRGEFAYWREIWLRRREDA